MRRWSLVAVALLAALALGRVIVVATDDKRIADAPFTRHGAVDERVPLDYADVVVRDVTTADTIKKLGRQVTTSATFLVLNIEVTTARETTTYPGPVIRDPSGRTFAVDTYRGCDTGITPVVAVPTPATYCFEVPQDAMEGAVLVFGRGAYGDDQRRDDVAVIDLGIDDERADELWQDTETLELT